MADPVPPPSPRQAMLAQLAGALAALGGKMRAQQQAAIDVCALGTRAEEIARSTRDLAFDRRRAPEGGLRALSGELDEFAAEMLATAERVQQDSLLGRAVAEALGGHAADLADLAQQREEAEDPAAIRTRLRPLVATLDALPVRMKASRERTAEVGALAARAQQAAAQAATLAAGAAPGAAPGRQDQMLALSRELNRLAQDAASVSAQFSADAAMAVRVAEDMAGQAAGLSTGRPAGPAAALSQVIGAGHAMEQAAEAAAPGQPPGGSHSWAGAMNWNLLRGRR